MWRVTPLLILRVTPLHFKFEEWLLSNSNVKSDSSSYQFWWVTRHVKGDSSLHQMWGVIYINVKCEECDSSPHEMWRVTPLQMCMWRVTPLHMKCEKWLLSTWNVKNDSSLHSPLWQIWRVLVSTSYVKSDSSLLWVTPLHIRASPLHIKCEEWLISTSYVKSDSSPHQMWRVTPLHIKSEVTPLDGKFEELLLSTSILKSDLYLRRVTPLHIKCEE
jgi:hypothetical protein